MFINKQEEFIVPTKNIRIEELDFDEVNFHTRETTKKIDNVEGFLEKKINCLFYKVIDLSKLISKNDVYYMYESIFKSMLIADINNISCFKAIKDNDINGMDEKKLIDIHLSKFKEVYEYHNNKFKYEENHIEPRKPLKIESLDYKLKSIDDDINGLFKGLSEKVETLSLNEILEIHLQLLKNILNLVIENISCFSMIKDKLNEQQLQAIIKIHVVKFTELFNKHVSLLKCS